MLTRSTGLAVSARGRGAAAIDHVDVKVGYGIDSSADQGGWTASGGFQPRATCS
ncbi:hypothetical protein [Xylella fastidiosa]|uniref:hypothetical protein n=1 Tax=Xylella fastidiosa TaxID=2371 RepID=UPI0013867C17|nr:hypothetical protein [Xylella fastidiosa]QPC04558.1 hypothetical protein IUD25_01215 [Xylella fastidiosa subsp. fastidiosa]UIT50286.1 hypothetical protein LZ752_01225 [Xylella fastidiosa subsp. fastidiosa]WCF14230.1 hypothetical protein OK115_07120 [Xylella fastidiosa subsp. fastidiosa]WCF19708.1 hypothetical protein OK118_01255 [Xylella fastidiosa subsp. fastidiosa]WCF21928.1 hypothetical protein OK114_01300 [Xylella fastidiosa subsp. fastidiosa]